MSEELGKFWLKYSCGCAEKISCSAMQAKGWRALVQSAQTFCAKHQRAAKLIGFTARKED